MDQRRLYRTIEKVINEAPKLENDEKLLGYVLEQIIHNEEIDIIGGRLWKLEDDKKCYTLIKQEGDVDIIEDNYKVYIEKYPMFKKVGQQRSVIAAETDEYLIEKGIYHYSATGVGERYKIKNHSGEFYYLYQYLIALNAKSIDESLLNTLNIISTTLSSILRSRKIETIARKDLEELEKAKEIQQGILPEHEMKFGNYEIFGISIPDRLVGGDFFDYIGDEESDRLGIAIGDAASKGFSAAAQALYVSGALRMGMEFNIKMATVIEKINRLVYDTFHYERFVTLFYCEIHTDKKGLCQFVSAGHNSPLFLHSDTKEIEALDTTGPVLGPSPKQRYYSDSINLKENDILVLHSDGITEAANINFEFYGEQRLKEKIMEYRVLSSREICENIIGDVEKFSANGKYSDDKTLVVIKRIK